MQKAKELSEGKVAIGAGTMYGATSNMMKKGWIEEILEEAKDDRGKRLYQLTENGKSVLKQEVVRLENLIKNAKSVMEN
jgi:DNA-binding PadR family transcriptional regulator